MQFIELIIILCLFILNEFQNIICHYLLLDFTHLTDLCSFYIKNYKFMN